jgi:hypothetical protein
MTENDNQSDESTANDYADAEMDLAAENRELRERVDELEAQLSTIQERLGETTARSDSPDEVTGEASDSPATGEMAQTTTNVTNPPSKVIGELSNSSGVGVYGENTASSGANYGVKGVTNSSNFSAAGVYGKGNNRAGGILAEATNNYAVTAISTGSVGTYSQSDEADASAVWGESSASDGLSHGVLGRNNSEDTNAAGVRGRAMAVSGKPVGVFGTTNSSEDGSVGVKGKARPNSGTVHGVEGQTRSPEGFGLYTPDDANVGDDLIIGGSVSIGTLGATPYIQNGPETVTEDGSYKLAPFNGTTRDDLGGVFTSGTGKYTVPEDGTYRVNATINASNSDAQFDLKLTAGGTTEATRKGNVDSATISKTINDVKSEEEVALKIRPEPNKGDLDLPEGRSYNYMDIDKIG